MRWRSAPTASPSPLNGSAQPRLLLPPLLFHVRRRLQLRHPLPPLSRHPHRLLYPTAAPVPGSGTTVAAPMPGNILKVMVKPGDAVKSGQILLLLEAMKMENEIYSPCDGTVSSVLVSVGGTVNSNDPMVVIG